MGQASACCDTSAAAPDGALCPRHFRSPMDETEETLAHGEFTISLVKEEGVSLGVDVDPGVGSSLLIDSVNPGLIQSWNRSHPDEMVEPGDYIIEVNGVLGEASR